MYGSKEAARARVANSVHAGEQTATPTEGYNTVLGYNYMRNAFVEGIHRYFLDLGRREVTSTDRLTRRL